MRWQGVRLYSEATNGYTSTRGKKRRPEKQKIVVLNPQAMRSRQRLNDSELRRQQKQKRAHNESLSILEGVDLGYSNTRTVDQADSKADILKELDKKGKNLLVFKSSVSEEQAIRSIDSQRPVKLEMSKQRYEQLKNLLQSAYTASQLQGYCKKMFKHGMVNKNKKTLISKIMNEFWGCKIDENMKEEEDLIVERSIDITTRDMSLLLLTDNGKILHNMARIGAILAVSPEENKIIIRASLNVIRYVEISLDRILKNVYTEDIPIKDIIKNHSENFNLAVNDINHIVDLVQREADVYIEKSADSSSDDIYSVSSFGKKRIETAKLLLVWMGNYEPQTTMSKLIAPVAESVSEPLEYPYTNMESFDWLNRTKQWFRLQYPEKKGGEAIVSCDQNIVNENLLKKLYNSLFEKDNASKLVSVNTERRSVFSITIGDVLQTLDKKYSYFQPRIPSIRNHLLNLPAYDDAIDPYSMDDYEYYAQLKFNPDLSSIENKDKLPPPVEMWFELDEREVAVIRSLNLIFSMNQNQILLQTPSLDNDFKFTVDTVATLIEPSESDKMDWTEEQLGVMEFIEKSNFDFRPNKKLSLYKNLEVKVPVNGENGKETINVKYDFVNSNVHRILRLKYLKKYMVQFSEVNGGARGGYYTQIDIIGEECPTFEEFSLFVNDVLKFGTNIKIPQRG